MTKYYITKKNRYTNSPYSGPSCVKAGVPVGKVYDSLEEIETDLKKLNEVNAIGFKIVVMK